jgi:hypothetical protein
MNSFGHSLETKIIPTSVKNKFFYTGFERLEIFSTFKWNWKGVPVLNSVVLVISFAFGTTKLYCLPLVE